jgi:TonB family protein
MKFVLTLISILAATLLAPNADAQLPETAGIANQMAEALIRAKQKSVIVFDFSGPREDVSTLGQDLAHNFSLAVTANKAAIQVVDQSKVKALCVEQGLTDSAARDTSTAAWIGQQFHADAVILGRISIVDSNLLLKVSSYRSQNEKLIAEMSMTAPLTDDLRVLMTKQGYAMRLAQRDPTLSVPGTHGVTFPHCVYCPTANYSDEARHKRLQGTVTLAAIVGTDGKARDIVVVKGLPYGLAKQAVEAVSRWTFVPASGPDGTPTDARQVIEVSFHLY